MTLNYRCSFTGLGLRSSKTSRYMSSL